MANLGTVGSNWSNGCLSNSPISFPRTGILVGSYDTTERLLMKALDQDRVEQIMEEIRGPAGRTMWDKLATSTKACWPTI